MQLQKLEIKLRHFDQIEQVMQEERMQLAAQRSALLSERVKFYAEATEIARAIQANDQLIDQGQDPTIMETVQKTLNKYKPSI